MGLAGGLQNPWFSPEPKRIARTRWPRRYNEKTASVHVADLESGRALARVSPGGATDVNVRGSCWNAATDRIDFSLERDAPDWTYSAAPDGRDLRRLVRLSRRLAIDPSFAPDAGASSSRSRSTTRRGTARSTSRTPTAPRAGA